MLDACSTKPGEGKGICYNIYQKNYFTKITSVNWFFVAWCATPPSLPHGTVYFSPNNACDNETCPTNTTASFICDPEYYLVGFGSIWCVGNGEWNLPFPTCEGKSKSQTE